MLKSRDKNGDGVLSFQEYLGERGEGKDKEWLLTEKDRSANSYLTYKKIEKYFEK